MGRRSTIIDLYVRASLPSHLETTPVWDRLQRVERKRTSLVALAAEFGLRAVEGFVLTSPTAMTSNEVITDLRSECSRRAWSTVVLDDGLDIVERRTDVSAIGIERPRYDAPTAVMCRRFTGGDLGMTTTIVGNRFLVEWCSAGLVALNRGTGSTRSAYVAHPRQSTEVPVDGHVLERMLSLTRAAHTATGGHLVLEWVAVEDDAVLVDQTRIAKSVIGVDVDHVLSPGHAEGPVIHIRRTTQLDNASEGPTVSVLDIGAPPDGLLDDLTFPHRPAIVAAERPFAALAHVTEHAVGFVFLEGSITTHLAIILRELSLPAVVTTHIPADARWARIDDGMVEWETPGA